MPVPPFLVAAAKLGLAPVAKLAWDAVKDNRAVQERGRQLLDQLLAARRRSSRVERLNATIAVIRSAAAELGAEAGDDDARAAGWVRRADGLTRSVRLADAATGLQRTRLLRQVSRQVGRLQTEVFAATLGVDAHDLPPEPDDPQLTA